MLADGTIRRISGSFRTRSFYARSPRGHVNIKEPQRRAWIRKERIRSEGSNGGGMVSILVSYLRGHRRLSFYFLCM